MAALHQAKPALFVEMLRKQAEAKSGESSRICTNVRHIHRGTSGKATMRFRNRTTANFKETEE